MKDFIKRTAVGACIYFTVITFIYALIVFIVYKGTADGGLLSSFRTVMFFVFSALLSAANNLLAVKSLSAPLRLIFHFLLTAVGFCLCMILPAGINGSTVLVGMFIYLLLYAVVTVVVIFIRSSGKVKKERGDDYSPMFKNK